MAVLGHKTLTEAERYTRDADQAKLAEAAMARLERVKKTSNSQPLQKRVGENQKKAKEIKPMITAMALPRGLEPLFSP